MKFEEVFSKAFWITMPDEDFPVLRNCFEIPAGEKIKKATLYALGLGFFRCYVNGKEVTERAFLPLSTDYEKRPDYPRGEEVTGHRVYVPTFDVTEILHAGKNLFSMYFGGGWYCFWSKKDAGKSNAYYDANVRYGDPKACYRLSIELESGKRLEVFSSEEDKVASGGVYDYSLTTHECRDLNALPEEALVSIDFDDSSWKYAKKAGSMDTDYLFTDCPVDIVNEKLPVKPVEPFVRLGKSAGVLPKIYDCGLNTSGYPVLQIHAEKGEKITVLFSELLNKDHTLDMERNHNQRFEFISDGSGRIVMPEFTWFGFRYFSVTGNAEPLYVAVVHTGVKVTSEFQSDNEVLNYLYKTYLNTQLNNMHTGIPSDCPHIERRGYTGDGQLTAHAAMTVLGAKEFYKKWIEDISDCQDTISGHVQYTAPFINSGGGPGAWGCAIVEVPYQYYLHYGDPEPMLRLYPQMKEYFRYLEDHSENFLITSDKEGEWCLGDWCAPFQVIVPAAFVNNYYYIKSLKTAVEIAELGGFTDDIPLFEKRLEERRKATKAAFRNSWDQNFIGNLQGSNAFAVDAGIGDPETYEHLVERYQELGEFDTGICGTDVLLKVLFGNGDAETAVALLTSEKPNSFGGLMKIGATTLSEYWPNSGGKGRSLNHPMFGAAASYLFTEILGIRRKEGTAGYGELVIEPCFPKKLHEVSGAQEVLTGRLEVSYVTDLHGEEAKVKIDLPKGTEAVFRHFGEEKKLLAGLNEFVVKL